MNIAIYPFLSILFVFNAAYSATFRELYEAKFPGIFAEENLDKQFVQPGILLGPSTKSRLMKLIDDLDAGKEISKDGVFIETFAFDYFQNPISKEILDKLLEMNPSTEIIVEMFLSSIMHERELFFQHLLEKSSPVFQEALNSDSSNANSSLLQVMFAPGRLNYLQKLLSHNFNIPWLEVFIYYALENLAEELNFGHAVELMIYLSRSGIDLNSTILNEYDIPEHYPIHIFLNSSCRKELKQFMLKELLSLGINLNVLNNNGETAAEIVTRQELNDLK